MRVGRIEIKHRAVVALLGMAVATGAWYFWARSRMPRPVEIRPEAPPVLQITGRAAGDLLREQAEFFDPTPLFFPTPQNFGQGRPIGALRREPAEGFGEFPPDLQFERQKLPVYGLDDEPAPERPVDILGRGDEAPFAGFGQSDLQPAPLPERSGFVEVKALADGRLALSGALAAGVLPPVEFAPLEFLVVVGVNGVVGEPLLIRNSGSEQVDAFLRDYLVKSFRLGERVGPGKYVVAVGP